MKKGIMTLKELRKLHNKIAKPHADFIGEILSTDIGGTKRTRYPKYATHK